MRRREGNCIRAGRAVFGAVIKAYHVFSYLGYYSPQMSLRLSRINPVLLVVVFDEEKWLLLDSTSDS